MLKVQNHQTLYITYLHILNQKNVSRIIIKEFSTFTQFQEPQKMEPKGSFYSQDQVLRVLKSVLCSTNLYFEVEWQHIGSSINFLLQRLPRANGVKPSNSTVSRLDLHRYCPVALLNFYEEFLSYHNQETNALIQSNLQLGLSFLKQPEEEDVAESPVNFFNSAIAPVPQVQNMLPPQSILQTKASTTIEEAEINGKKGDTDPKNNLSSSGPKQMQEVKMMRLNQEIRSEPSKGRDGKWRSITATVKALEDFERSNCSTPELSRGRSKVSSSKKSGQYVGTNCSVPPSEFESASRGKSEKSVSKKKVKPPKKPKDTKPTVSIPEEKKKQPQKAKEAASTRGRSKKSRGKETERSENEQSQTQSRAKGKRGKAASPLDYQDYLQKNNLVELVKKQRLKIKVNNINLKQHRTMKIKF